MHTEQNTWRQFESRHTQTDTNRHTQTQSDKNCLHFEKMLGPKWKRNNSTANSQDKSNYRQKSSTLG